MNELPQSRFKICAALLSHFPYSRSAVSAALSGAQQARIFVYSVDAARVAVLFHFNTYVMLAGDDGNGDVWRFLNEVKPDQIFGKNRFVFISETPQWEARLRKWGRGCLEEDRRLSFEFNARLHSQHGEWRQALEDGAKVSPITSEMLGPGTSSLFPHFEESWDTWADADAFAKSGFGFLLTTSSGEPISSCYTYTAGGDLAEIQIQTVDAFRGRGYATLVGSAFIEECLKRNLDPYWECSEGNETSSGLARKLGFREVGSFCRLWLSDPPLKTLLQRATELGDLAQTRDLLASGEDPNVRNTSDSTALHHAIWAYDEGVLKEIVLHQILSMLIAHDADVNAVHRRVGTPLDYSQTVATDATCSLLRAHGGKTSCEL